MKYNKNISDIIDSQENVYDGFEDIFELSMRCKFSDCTHTNESDCAVKMAISEGNLSTEGLIITIDLNTKRSMFLSKRIKRKLSNI